MSSQFFSAKDWRVRAGINVVPSFLGFLLVALQNFASSLKSDVALRPEAGSLVLDVRVHCGEIIALFYV